jgi:hypothetical protein
VPLEGVVDALRRIHAALAPGGLLVDTQPVSIQPPVLANGVALGTLDMRAWGQTIRAIDELADQVIGELFSLEGEQQFVVTDTFDSGAEFVQCASEWRGAVVPPDLSERATVVTPPLAIDQDVRLRLFRARD